MLLYEYIIRPNSCYLVLHIADKKITDFILLWINRYRKSVISWNPAYLQAHKQWLMNNIFFSRCRSRTENICKVYASFSNFARCSMLWKLYFGYNGRIWAVAYVVSGIYCNKRNNWRCHILCTLLFKRSGKHVNYESALNYIISPGKPFHR